MIKIKFFVMDVDGTLTDGKIYMGNSGEVVKAFSIKDGYAIQNILPKYDIIPIIITGRDSNILYNRCKELNIINLHQGVKDKLDCLCKILNQFSEQDKILYDYSYVAYIGDDNNDLICMDTIKDNGGLVGCPNDAVKDVKKIANFISDNKGGEGAVREFIEWLLLKVNNENE